MKERLRTTLIILLLNALLFSLPFSVIAKFQEQDWVARLRKEDREWARKAGLSPEAMRKMRLSAGVPDDVADYVDYIDAKSLRARKHILFVIAGGGNGHCLSLYIFRRTNYRLLWSAPGMPSGAGYCRESPYNPKAYVARGGKIVVKIPVFDYERGKAEAIDYYTYVWTGRTYKFAGSRTVKVHAR